MKFDDCTHALVKVQEIDEVYDIGNGKLGYINDNYNNVFKPILNSSNVKITDLKDSPIEVTVIQNGLHRVRNEVRGRCISLGKYIENIERDESKVSV